jgi:hypothetical protein
VFINLPVHPHIHIIKHIKDFTFTELDVELNCHFMSVLNQSISTEQPLHGPRKAKYSKEVDL